MATTYVRNDAGQFELVGPGGATTDTTLSQAGKPADAAAVGNAIAMIQPNMPKTQKLLDETLTESKSMFSIPLEHNFHRLFLVWACDSNGSARTVDVDGNVVESNLHVLIDTDEYSYNNRKVGLIVGSTNTWQTDSLLMEWTADMSTFLHSTCSKISLNSKSDVYHQFGGTTAMLGTLGVDTYAPTVGRTINIVTNTGFFAPGTRIVLVGEYYN